MLKWKLLSVTSLLLTLGLAGAAGAGPVYRWVGEDGSVAYSDELKRIPAEYRASAKRVKSGDLGGYARYTPAETRAASQQRMLQLNDRLERLRETNGNDGLTGKRSVASDTSTILRLDNRSSITIPNERLASGEPIVVEQRRVRDRNNISTTHVTVVRQGDEVLSVMRPESAHDRADWRSERELIPDAE